MHTPTPWDDDPACGHLVANRYQTHYCTYERVPRLLSLDRHLTDQHDEVWALRLLQSYELWCLVLARDLREILREDGSTSESRAERNKQLRRGAAILELLDHQTELAHRFLLDDLGLEVPVSPWQRSSPSPGFVRVCDLVQRLRHDLEDGMEERPAAEFLHRFDAWAPVFSELLDGLLVEDARAEPSYEAYIQLSELSSLQTGVKAEWSPIGDAPGGISPTESPSSDEMMFIVVHQAFELWFHILLHELDSVRGALVRNPADVPEAIRRMRRVVPGQKLLIEQIHIPATMRPSDFLEFRHETQLRNGTTYERGLSPASGTESYQFREIEIIGGLAESEAYREFLRGNEDMHIRFMTPTHQERMGQANLPELFENVLRRRGIDHVMQIYQGRGARGPNHELAELADLLLEFDQFFQLWRVNHLVMVQSMIGRKSGTGHLGPEYLQETVGMGRKPASDRLLDQPQSRPRFFERLWEARTELEGEVTVDGA